MRVSSVMKVIRVKKVQEDSEVKMLCSQVGECRCLQADSCSLLQPLKFVGEVALAKVPAINKQEKNVGSSTFLKQGFDVPNVKSMLTAC
jgi:hypothetical protein